MDSRAHVIPARPSNVLPCNIADLQLGAITILVRVNARRDVYWLIDVLEVDVAERDVLDMSLAWVSLDPGSIRRMDRGDVFKKDVVDVVRGAGGVAQRTDAHCAAFVTGHVFDVDVAAVTFDGYTVIAAGYDPVLDEYVFRIPGVSPISVDCRPLGIGCSVHVEVCHCDIL